MAQYPETPGQSPGICSSTPGSCSTHRGMSVHVPSSWQRGTLFLPASHTTWQDCPGKDSEQYPGNPGQVVSADAPAARAAKRRIFLEHAMPFEDKLVLKLGLVSSLCTHARKVYSQLARRARPRPSKQQACAGIRRSRTLEAGTTGIRALEPPRTKSMTHVVEAAAAGYKLKTG